MQILWRLGDAVVNDIIARTDEPHPKYTTVATFLKILENKGFVSHTAEGKSHRYFPLIGREEYARGVMSSMLSSYFDGSLAQLVSFFSRHENISSINLVKSLGFISEGTAYSYVKLNGSWQDHLRFVYIS